MKFELEKPPEKQPSAAWLITFGDLTALMLTFFIMLFATAHIPSEKWNAILGTMSTAFRFDEQGMTAVPRAELAIPALTPAPAHAIEYLASVFRKNLETDPILKEALLVSQDDRLVISLPNSVLFREGSSELGETAAAAMFGLGGLFANIGNEIEIRGHAEPSAAEGETFRANWRLSLERAVTVAELLRQSGYSRPFPVLGLGDSRFKILSEELPLERRRALARRVDIVVYSDAGA